VSPKGYTPPVSDDAAQALAQILPQTEVVNAIAQRIHELAREWWPPKPAAPTPFLSLDEAARYSGLPRRLLVRWARNGTLRAVRFSGEWIVKKSDLDAVELPASSAVVER
jgi:excisionase family DNA binding protein